MSRALWIIFFVIGGCIAFVIALHYMGEGDRIAQELIQDQPAEDEFKTQVDGEIYKEMLKGVTGLLITLPLMAFALNSIFYFRVEWLMFSVAFLPVIRWQARKKIYRKYDIR